MGGRRAAIEDGMTYRQVERALRRMGFRVLRHSGDHAIWGKGPLRVAVRQGHPTERVPRNTVRQMALQARGEQPWSWGGVAHRGKGDPMGERTGLERLRELGREQEERSWSTVGKIRGRTMREIADQIEREHKVDYRARFDRDVVRNVLCDMERHVSGVEGAGDSPVALWARELREAMGGSEQDPTKDVSMSAYDLLPSDEREAIAWVREHGGMEKVRDEWSRRSNLKRQLDSALAKVERQKRHIMFVQTKCRERRKYIHELNKTIADMRPRLMPEGMEWLVEAWPRFEDGEPVRVGSDFADGLGETHTITSIEFFEGHVELHWNPDEPSEFEWLEPGERVKRPESKCRDCAHWQKDPTANNMGVCWFYYHEHEGQDCYAARRGDIGACEEFMPRGKELAGDA